MGIEQRITPAAAASNHPHLLTVAEFITLRDAGVFDAIGRVELIEGEVFAMAPLYFPHARVHANLTIDVGNAVRSLDSTLEVLNPVSAVLNPYNLAEADIVVVDAEGFSGTVIDAEMVRLVIEVSASSLRYDRGPKLRLYARTSIPEYWIADVVARQILRLHAPHSEQYTQSAAFPFGEPVASATISGLIVDTSRLA